MRALWSLLAAGGALCSPLPAFIGPFAPRVGATNPTPPSPPPPLPYGLSHDEVCSLLSHRNALVIAGEDEGHAIMVASSLADVGANVLLACQRPHRVQPTCDRITRNCRKSITVSGNDENSAPEGESTGCAEARYLDLTSPEGVWRFADSWLSEDRPLHVIVNCADDVAPWYRPPREGGWEGTIGRTHIGPFLLTQLLLDRMVETMRRDAKAFERQQRLRSTEERMAAEREREEKRTLLARGKLPPTSELRARPYPAPFGRLVTLGLRARISARHPNPVAGLHIGEGNFSSWLAYRSAHEANLLSSLQLSRLLAAAVRSLLHALPS